MVAFLISNAKSGVLVNLLFVFVCKTYTPESVIHKFLLLLRLL